jgi:hypothetical protein
MATTSSCNSYIYPTSFKKTEFYQMYITEKSVNECHEEKDEEVTRLFTTII